MKKALVVYEQETEEMYRQLIKYIEEYFGKENFEAEELCITDGMEADICHKKFAEPELAYICTLDMAGFQMKTTMGMPRYNIAAAKQIHIIINEEIFVLYRNTEFALNLYLFFPNTVKEGTLKEVYIPNIFFYRPFNLGQDSPEDKSELISMIKKVREDCENLHL